MPRTHRAVAPHHKHSVGGKEPDATTTLDDPFDLALYTPEYTQPDSAVKNFRDGDAAWTRFLVARPLLYLPDRSPVTDEDPINRHRRVWTRQELQVFGDVVEERTRAQLLLQEQTLRRWLQSATHLQRRFRGMRGRMRVLRLRQELFEYAATLERAMELARERRRRHKAAVAIQRLYRCHRKHVDRRQRAAMTLQGASKRFMHRLRRWQARLALQHAAHCFLWRLRWQRHRQRVRKMLHAAARKHQLVQTAQAFQRVRENVLLQRQRDAWSAHPERMQMLLRARRRQQTLNTSASVGVFPPLRAPAKLRSAAAKASKESTGHPRQQEVSLPSVCPYSRGE
jgi:hypothetical protein